MPTKNVKKNDPHIWERMGRELAALHELIGAIRSDKDYNAVMDSKTWDRLEKLTYHLDNIRSIAEDRMARYIPDWTTDTFYPRDREKMMVAIAAFREKVREEDKLNDQA